VRACATQIDRLLKLSAALDRAGENTDALAKLVRALAV
jgi:hypothetical protein